MLPWLHRLMHVALETANDRSHPQHTYTYIAQLYSVITYIIAE